MKKLTYSIFKVVMEVDKAFQEMHDTAWPKALEYFKEVCERQEKI